ncbi:MAG: hypothetical protein ACOCOU_10480, partial [Prevotella sp.]
MEYSCYICNVYITKSHLKALALVVLAGFFAILRSALIDTMDLKKKIEFKSSMSFRKQIKKISVVALLA